MNKTTKWLLNFADLLLMGANVPSNSAIQAPELFRLLAALTPLIINISSSFKLEVALQLSTHH